MSEELHHCLSEERLFASAPVVFQWNSLTLCVCEWYCCLRDYTHASRSLWSLEENSGCHRFGVCGNFAFKVMWCPRANQQSIMGREVTFSSSWRSCLVRASLEHMVCWGATTVHTHLPSLSWAELYTCQDSSGLAGKTCERAERTRRVILPSITTSKVHSLIYNPILIGITNTWHKIT